MYSKKKFSVHGNVKSLISKQILLIQYAFEIFVSKALFIWSPDIVPQINIDQESIKWIFNSGLFWAVEAAEKKKSKLPWVCYFWGQFFHVFKANFFWNIVKLSRSRNKYSEFVSFIFWEKLRLDKFVSRLIDSTLYTKKLHSLKVGKNLRNFRAFYFTLK